VGGGSEGLCCLCGGEKRVRGWKMIDGGVSSGLFGGLLEGLYW